MKRKTNNELNNSINLFVSKGYYKISEAIKWRGSFLVK